MGNSSASMCDGIAYTARGGYNKEQYEAAIVSEFICNSGGIRKNPYARDNRFGAITFANSLNSFADGLRNCTKR